jgi:hypothetical protein
MDNCTGRLLIIGLLAAFLCQRAGKYVLLIFNSIGIVRQSQTWRRVGKGKMLERVSNWTESYGQVFFDVEQESKSD